MADTVTKYPGQKAIEGLYHKIINEIPVCRYYHEPFAGSAQIARKIAVGSSQVKIFLNDIDKNVTDCFPLPGAIVANVHVLHYIKKVLSGSGKDHFAFFDPPYIHDTRPNNIDLYANEMTIDDHYDFISAARRLPCNVMIIHPDYPLYNNYLRDWRKVQVRVRYHNKTSLENLYMNYQPPDVLLMDDYLGVDCWDRQRIKRKGERLINKLSLLQPRERNFLIKRINDEFKPIQK